MQDPIIGSDSDAVVENEKFTPELGKLMIRDLYRGEETTPQVSDLRLIDSINENDGFTNWHYQQIAKQQLGYGNPEIYFSEGVDSATDGKVVKWNLDTRIEHRYATDEDLSDWVQKLKLKYDESRMEVWIDDISQMTKINKEELLRLQEKIKK